MIINTTKIRGGRRTRTPCARTAGWNRPLWFWNGRGVAPKRSSRPCQRRRTREHDLRREKTTVAATWHTTAVTLAHRAPLSHTRANLGPKPRRIRIILPASTAIGAEPDFVDGVLRASCHLIKKNKKLMKQFFPFFYTHRNEYTKLHKHFRIF